LAAERQLEYEQERFGAAEAERAQARRLADLERAERNAKLQEEMRQQTNRQMRDRQLSDLHQASIGNEQFRNAAVRAAGLAHQRQELSKVLDNFMTLKYRPPPPEPTVVVVSEDDGSADFGSPNFDVAKWAKKPRSWF
jgi:hypothetical protein